MTFLFPFPQDGRVHRDEDISELMASLKNANQRTARSDTINGTATPAEQPIQDVADTTPGVAIARRNVVFPDPVAFRYLESDPCVTVVERRGVLRGYELYLVEQWACSRQSPTLVVVTYTGDERHSVVAGVLGVPADDSLWSAKLRVYFKATHQYHARPKDTELGELMVTNLSSFPSALTVIPVPDGDIRKHRQAFIVNEDLKRLGCSGRSGLTLTAPTEATQSKFQQLYKTSDRIPFSQSVTELIKLCQVALYMFEKLEHEYIDGLLCDVTERAIANWWTEVGAEHYNFEPTDGILGPSTVAALLGMIMGARNRLHWYGAPVAKDVFDIDSTKRGIAYFQKSIKVEKTRRLDRQTLFRLHAATAKAAVGEGWGVQKAVKSTVTEIGGKRGEIVMGMVSGKDKAGLADIETLDIDRFVSLVSGERAKWLWHGKPRRTPTDHQDHDRNISSAVYGRDETVAQAAKRIQSLPSEDVMEANRKDDQSAVYSTVPPGSATSMTDSPGERDALHKTVLKSVAGKMNDARSGLGRFKDAVGGGLRGHGNRPSISAREEFTESGNSGANTAIFPQPTSLTMSPSTAGVGRAFTWKNKPEEYLAAIKRGDSEALPDFGVDLRATSSPTLNSKASNNNSAGDAEKQSTADSVLNNIGAEVRGDVLSRVPSAVRSTFDATDLQGPLLDADRKNDPRQLVLTRRHSVEIAELTLRHVMNENRWARRVSFGDAERAVLAWEEIIGITDVADDARTLHSSAEVARHLNQSVEDIIYDVEPWVEERLKMVAALDDRYARDKEDIQQLYYQLSDACQRVRGSSDELLAEERAHLTESVKEIEVLLARLEYEITALVQKVNDVEDGVRNYERQVDDLEKRAEELKIQLETESWPHWFVRTLTGVGTGPNITRSRR